MLIRTLPGVLLLMVIGCKASPHPQQSLLNFRHLEHLTERIEFFGDTVEIVHVYSKYPNYEWVDAKESGPEGIACVDDAARAAVVYLRHFELTGSDASLRHALALLKFILKMETDDGQFYNFIFADHSMNRGGKTGYKSFGWWAARGVWAMSFGYKIFKPRNPEFAAVLKQAVERSFPQIDALMKEYRRFEKVKNRTIPKWLIFQYDTYTASATSELLIGLCEFYAAEPQPRVKEYIDKFVTGLIHLQVGDFKTPPYGAFLSEDSQWHDWANCQSQAIAMAGKLLGRSDWIDAVEKEVRWFYVRLLIDGHMREFPLDSMASSKRFPQIAYGFRPMVLGDLRLADATGKTEYRQIAGLIASWFLGDNSAQAQVYDPATGRCYDGISDSTTINRNSGAESTVEALYSILEVEQDSVASKYLRYRKTVCGRGSQHDFVFFRGPLGDQVALVLDFDKKDLVVFEGERAREFEAIMK